MIDLFPFVPGGSNDKTTISLSLDGPERSPERRWKQVTGGLH